MTALRCLIPSCIFVNFFGCEYIPDASSLRATKTNSSVLLSPALHSVPFLIRQWDELPDNVDIEEMIGSTVLAGIELCQIGPIFDCFKIRSAINQVQTNVSFYDLAIVSAAVHFGDLVAITPVPLRTDLLELSMGLFEMIGNKVREKFARNLEGFFSKYKNRFLQIFGTTKYAYQSFEFLFAVLHMDGIPIDKRREIMSAFAKFMDQAFVILDRNTPIFGGEFERVMQVMKLRNTQLDPIVAQMRQLLLS